MERDGAGIITVSDVVAAGLMITSVYSALNEPSRSVDFRTSDFLHFRGPQNSRSDPERTFDIQQEDSLLTAKPYQPQLTITQEQCQRCPARASLTTVSSAPSKFLASPRTSRHLARLGVIRQCSTHIIGKQEAAIIALAFYVRETTMPSKYEKEEDIQS